MAAPLIFVPRAASIAAADVFRPLGLADLLVEGIAWEGSRVETEAGPDGENPGALFGIDRGPHDSRACRVAFVPEQQEWVPCKPLPQPTGEPLKGGRFWLGIERDARPVPWDLQRPNMHRGIAVTLDDGHDWTVPTPNLLPHVVAIDETTGKDVWLLDERFQDFARRAAEYWDLSVATHKAWRGGNHDVPQPTIEAVDLARRSLAMNYVLNRDLIDLLGLLRQPATIFAVPWAVLDLQAIVDAEGAKNVAHSTVRWLASRAWQKGLAPAGYQPTMFDLSQLE